MDETLNKGEKKVVRDKNGRFLRNPKGRPKGAKDKIARSVKHDIEKAFEGLGGIEGLIKWGKKNNRNQEKLYDWYFSMLPKNVDAKHSGELIAKLTFDFGENGE